MRMKQGACHQLRFTYGDEEIIAARVARSEAVNRILVKVYPDCRVEVMAPESASDQEVIAALIKRRRWIYEQLRDFRKQLEHVSPRQYVSGESHYYLGKQYLLKVLATPDAVPSVKLLRGKLEVVVRAKDPSYVKQLLSDWYKLRAKEVFTARLGAMLEQALWVTDAPDLRILTMKTQWGSCSPKGRLTLNPHLVKAPRECIDYVLLHELCHLAEHNHSDRFYRLMDKVMPSWEKTKKRLDGMANAILG